MMTDPGMTDNVYKIIDSASWQRAEESGLFKGNEDDARDGFIHLSTAPQVARVLKKFFAGQSDLLVIEIPLELIEDQVRFEEASDGQLYPHIYGDLPTKFASRTFALKLDGDGEHILPFEGTE